MTMRVGVGYDVHPLSKERPLVLGGVRVPHDRGLDGWSDGDVLCHAIIDALLGAAGLGDIGQHFPPGAPQYLGVSSLALLERVSQLLGERGWRVGNIDATIVAERPRLAEYIDGMRQALASALMVEASQIGVKATTTEGLGFIGRGDGMAALAVALIGEV